MDHVICCSTNDPPPTLGGCQTAFAKGQWVWTTDTAKSNPEKLPTLYLIRNRWGWAINLKTGGQYSFPIYAGAGLNNIQSRTPVGTLSVNWFDSDDDPLGIPDRVRVSYQLLPGYRLAETHLYASNQPPTTTAPGQYGNNHDYFTACENVNYDFYDLPLVDNTGLDVCKAGAGSVTGGAAPPATCDGVWIIAHAVVCDAAVCTP